MRNPFNFGDPITSKSGIIKKMKKNILLINVIAIAFSAMVINGCKKSDDTASSSGSDNTPPAITITGSNPASVTLGHSYSDAGATASDLVDGTVAVTSSGNVNTGVAGAYTITYSASDQAGNSVTAARTVNVVIARENYIWDATTTVHHTYSAHDSSYVTGVSTYTGTISAGTAANAIVIHNLVSSGAGTNCNATISGATVTITNAVISSYTVNGTGTMNSTGTQITLNYTTTLGAGTIQHHAILTRL